jgi:hypothetical protein
MTMLPAGVKVHLAFGHMRLQRAGSSRSSQITQSNRPTATCGRQQYSTCESRS